MLRPTRKDSPLITARITSSVFLEHIQFLEDHAYFMLMKMILVWEVTSSLKLQEMLEAE